MKKISVLVLLFLCAILLNAQSGSWLWAINAGGGRADFGRSIATHTTGDIYVAGDYYGGSAQFGSFILTSNGGNEGYIGKLDGSGNWLWVQNVGGQGHDSCQDVATDASGNCFVTGYYSANINFGDSILLGSGGNDLFIAKIDGNGTWLWARSASGSNHQEGYSISTDADGNCFVTGRFSGSTTFGSTHLSTAGDPKIFVAKLDADGNWLWATQAGGIGDDNGL